MTRATQTKRRVQLLDLARREAMKRCRTCKRDLAEVVKVLEVPLADGTVRKFCSESCYLDWQADDDAGRSKPTRMGRA